MTMPGPTSMAASPPTLSGRDGGAGWRNCPPHDTRLRPVKWGGGSSPSWWPNSEAFVRASGIRSVPWCSSQLCCKRHLGFVEPRTFACASRNAWTCGTRATSRPWSTTLRGRSFPGAPPPAPRRRGTGACLQRPRPLRPTPLGRPDSDQPLRRWSPPARRPMLEVGPPRVAGASGEASCPSRPDLGRG